MWTRATIFVLALTPLVNGCVTKAKHDDLKRQLDDTEAALRAEQRAEQSAYEEQLKLLGDRVETLDAAIERARNEAEDYRRQIALLETASANQDAELARLEERLSTTEGELVAVLDKRTALKASLVQMEAALAELRERQRAADRRVDEYRDMLRRFASLIDAGKLQVKVVDGRMVLTLPMDILFSSGRAMLTEEGHASIIEVGQGLATIPEREFQVEGYTDDVPIHSAKFPSNWELGSARALVVLRALEEGGVSPSRLSAATFGEHRPLGSNESAEGRAINRRIEIAIVPDLSSLPGYEELNRLGGDGVK